MTSGRNVKFVPLNVHAYCARAGRSWTLGFGWRGDGLSLFLMCADETASDPEPKVVAQIREARQIDAVVDRIADVSTNAKDIAIELFDLLVTLAMDFPDPDCKQYLVERMSDWIMRNRSSRLERGNAA
jgi:hypothetical protein